MISLQQKSKQNQQQSKQTVQMSKKEREFQAELRSFTKELLMEFHVFEKSELIHVLELSDYNLPAAQAYLRKNSKSKVRATLAKFLAGDLEPGLSALGLDKNFKEIKKEPEVVEEQLVEYGPIGPNLFELTATNEMIHYILDMLDPESLMRAGFTCKRFYQISLHPLHYKKFCRRLYRPMPPLPVETPFNTLSQRIITSVGEYHRQIVEKARQDIRSLVWLPSVKSYCTPSTFYNQFNGFRDVFLNAPRVRFAGVYMMKEKYIRSGTKDLTSFYDPYHTVEFFRYFRFFPDGLVMSTLSVNRLKKDKLLKVFSPSQQSTEEEMQFYAFKSNIKSVMKGEYVVKKSTMHIRLNAKPTIYEYELEIGATAPGCFDQLKMVSQHMRMAENEHRESIESEEHKGSKTFKFIKVPGLMDELDQNIVSVSY